MHILMTRLESSTVADEQFAVRNLLALRVYGHSIDNALHNAEMETETRR